MATHSSILAWRIPWTEELGRMAMGLQRDTIEVTLLVMVLDFPDVSVVKNLPASAGDTRDSGSTLGSGRPPGGGHSNTLQYSCLENPRGERNMVGYSPWGHKKSDTTEAT